MALYYGRGGRFYSTFCRVSARAGDEDDALQAALDARSKKGKGKKGVRSGCLCRAPSSIE
jgi:hypothetical protein